MPAIVPNERWCGIEATSATAAPALPCKYVGLPCGPVSAEHISHGGEASEDLDGDGNPDLSLAGRRSLPSAEIYAAIYRSTASGYVLADYQVAPKHAEPTVASVILAAPGQAPLLRDGYDIVEPGGRTISVGRLRRFDGQRFRTLLSFCAHRSEPLIGTPTNLREGHNRVEIVDVDKDGQKDIVLHGLLRPIVFRFTNNGLGLLQDPTLETIYRDHSPEAQRTKALRSEASRLLDSAQIRRAAEVLLRAQAVMPYDIPLTLEACALLLRSGQAEKALELLVRARYQAPNHAAIYCLMARAYRAQEDFLKERTALHTCLSKNPDEALRSEAEARLHDSSIKPQ